MKQPKQVSDAMKKAGGIIKQGWADAKAAGWKPKPSTTKKAAAKKRKTKKTYK